MRSWHRRSFLQTGLSAAAGISVLGSCGGSTPAGPEPPTPSPSPSPTNASVALVRADSYEASFDALSQAFTLLGGLRQLFAGKTVTVKVNLTGYATDILGRAPVLMYATHGDTVLALVTILTNLGVHRIRLVESASVPGTMTDYAASFDWDVAAIRSAGPVELTNTRNRGTEASYATLRTQTALLFDRFDVHRAYADTDVLVSLAKLKNHLAAGVTLSMKNLFGMMPSSLYGLDAGNEDAVGTRLAVHDRSNGIGAVLPGELPRYEAAGPDIRVPRTVVDLVSARPIDLAIIDGICAMSGGEGPWSAGASQLVAQTPHVMIVGRDAVATDAVAVSVMGYADPLAVGVPPFQFCENHLLLAHQAGIGIGDLARIDVRGERIADVRTPYAWVSP